MTERSTEPLKRSKEASVTEEGTHGSDMTQTRRLEALLVDAADSSQTSLSSHDVTIGCKEPATSTWQFIVLLFLMLLTIVLGFVLFKFYNHSEPKLIQSAPSVELKQSLPTRPTHEQPKTIFSGPVNENVEETVPAEHELVRDVEIGIIAVEKPLHTVVVGPFISGESLKNAEQTLAELGLQAEKESGRGMVSMIRLQEGIYSSAQAQKRLVKLKKIIKSAFLLPQGTKKVLYAGSFSEKDRALQLQAQLKQKHVDVELVKAEISMNGTLLIALKADQQTAGQLAQHIKERGLNVQVKQLR